MITENKNQQAFASAAISDKDFHHQDGLTKREYFAAAAMQGILANQDVKKMFLEDSHLNVVETAVHFSVRCADALLAKL